MKKVVNCAVALLVAGSMISCGGGKKTENENVVVLFDGSSLDGWRGYNKESVPARWTIEDGCLKFNKTGKGEGQGADGGDII